MRTQLESGRALQQAREQMDALFRLVRPGSLYKRPIAERHRIIFYLGHVDAFDWNLIGALCARRAGIPRGVRPAVRLRHRSAARRIAQRSAHRLARACRRCSATSSARAKIIDELLAEVPEQLLHVAIEHRLMHAETFTYILHQLAYDEKIAPHQADCRMAPAVARDSERRN